MKNADDRRRIILMVLVSSSGSPVPVNVIYKKIPSGLRPKNFNTIYEDCYYLMDRHYPIIKRENKQGFQYVGTVFGCGLNTTHISALTDIISAVEIFNLPKEYKEKIPYIWEVVMAIIKTKE